VAPARAAALAAPGGAPGGAPASAAWLGADLLILPARALRAAEWAGRERAAAAAIAFALGARRVARAAEIDAGKTRASRLEVLVPGPPPAAGAFQLPPPVPESAIVEWVSASRGAGAGAGAAADAAATREREGPGAAADAAALYPPPAAAAFVDSGAGGWVRVVEHGVVYTFDALRCMFSAGNAREKARMGALRLAPDETVVDLFAGIGYFSLPLLVRARAARLHAAEWNPDAVACLRLALRANGAADRATVWPGDCARLADEPTVAGAADRVLLGLLPSSRRGWRVALACLRARGGTLHVHENVAERGGGGGARAWADAQLLPELRRLADAAGRARWHFSLLHIERVKSYAPRVAHFVFDVRVTLREEGA
jgi:hypothetical protein